MTSGITDWFVLMFRSTRPAHRPTENCWCGQDICYTVMETTQRWWWIPTHWVRVWAPWVHSHHLDQSGEHSTGWADLRGHWVEWNHRLLFPCQCQEQTWSQFPSGDWVDCQAQEQVWWVFFIIYSQLFHVPCVDAWVPPCLALVEWV